MVPESDPTADGVQHSFAVVAQSLGPNVTLKTEAVDYALAPQAGPPEARSSVCSASGLLSRLSAADTTTSSGSLASSESRRTDAVAEVLVPFTRKRRRGGRKWGGRKAKRIKAEERANAEEELEVQEALEIDSCGESFL